MPAETSVGMSQETRDRLDDYRADGHHSIAEVIEGMMEIVPPAEEILGEDACAYQECEEPLWSPSRPEDRGGVIQWWAAEYDDSVVYGSAWFCSPEHAAAHQEEVDEMAATEPDKLVIGGGEEMEMELELPGMRLHHPTEYRDEHEVGIPVPVDLVGEDSHGEPFDYHGEPIEVWKAGKSRFSGEVADIIREETHTAILF